MSLFFLLKRSGDGKERASCPLSPCMGCSGPVLTAPSFEISAVTEPGLLVQNLNPSNITALLFSQVSMLSKRARDLLEPTVHLTPCLEDLALGGGLESRALGFVVFRSPHSLFCPAW